jgi:hypothetical protein
VGSAPSVGCSDDGTLEGVSIVSDGKAASVATGSESPGWFGDVA